MFFCAYKFGHSVQTADILDTGNKEHFFAEVSDPEPNIKNNADADSVPRRIRIRSVRLTVKNIRLE